MAIEWNQGWPSDKSEVQGSLVAWKLIVRAPISTHRHMKLSVRLMLFLAMKLLDALRARKSGSVDARCHRKFSFSFIIYWLHSYTAFCGGENCGKTSINFPIRLIIDKLIRFEHTLELRWSFMLTNSLHDVIEVWWLIQRVFFESFSFSKDSSGSNFLAFDAL